MSDLARLQPVPGMKNEYRGGYRIVTHPLGWVRKDKSLPPHE